MHAGVDVDSDKNVAVDKKSPSTFRRQWGRALTATCSDSYTAKCDIIQQHINTKAMWLMIGNITYYNIPHGDEWRATNVIIYCPGNYILFACSRGGVLKKWGDSGLGIVLLDFLLVVPFFENCGMYNNAIKLLLGL